MEVPVLIERKRRKTVAAQTTITNYNSNVVKPVTATTFSNIGCYGQQQQQKPRKRKRIGYVVVVNCVKSQQKWKKITFGSFHYFSSNLLIMSTKGGVYSLVVVVLSLFVLLTLTITVVTTATTIRIPLSIHSSSIISKTQHHPIVVVSSSWQLATTRTRRSSCCVASTRSCTCRRLKLLQLSFVSTTTTATRRRRYYLFSGDDEYDNSQRRQWNVTMSMTPSSSLSSLMTISESNTIYQANDNNNTSFSNNDNSINNTTTATSTQQLVVVPNDISTKAFVSSTSSLGDIMDGLTTTIIDTTTNTNTTSSSSLSSSTRRKGETGTIITLAKRYGITNPLDRMLVTANGNLQRLVSSYYDSPVSVIVDSCTIRSTSTSDTIETNRNDYRTTTFGTVPYTSSSESTSNSSSNSSGTSNNSITTTTASVCWDRTVRLQVHGTVFCTATSIITVYDPYCQQLVKSNQIGLGQLFRFLDILPEFILHDAGFYSNEQQQEHEHKGGFWRVYTLQCKQLSCYIREEFINNLWDIVPQ